MSSCLPQFQNQWCVTVNNSSVAFFVHQAKMQLRQVNENQNRFEINLAVTSWWVCIRSEVNSGACMTFNCVLTSNEKSQPLTSCIFIATSEDHTCPGTDLLPHFKAVFIFIDLVQLHFCLAYKNSHWAINDCHTPVILQLGKHKILIHLNKKKMLTKYFIRLIHRQC